MPDEPPSWRKIEWNDSPHYWESGDEGYYLREYKARKKWNASETNGLVSNLKMETKYRGQGRWHYKQQAIQRCAKEFADVFNPDHAYCVIPIPTSKVPADPEFDSRLNDVCRILARYRPNIRIETPIGITESHTATHLGNERRKPHEIHASLTWEDITSPTPPFLVLLDDVITCGAHFKACKRLIQEQHPDMRVVGVFWARSVWET